VVKRAEREKKRKKQAKDKLADISYLISEKIEKHQVVKSRAEDNTKQKQKLMETMLKKRMQSQNNQGMSQG